MNSLKQPSSLLCLILLLVLIVLLTAREIVQTDPLFDIAAGTQIFNDGLPFTNVFLQFHQDSPIHNHEWLYQIAIAACYSLGGFPALSVIKVSLITLFFTRAFTQLKTRSRSSAAFCLLLCLLASFPRLTLNPQLFSIFALPLVIELCERTRLQPNTKIFATLLLIQVLWINIHPLWILGWSCCQVYLIEQLVAKKLKFLCATQRNSTAQFAKLSALFTGLAFTSPYTWPSAFDLIDPILKIVKILGNASEQPRILTLQKPLLGSFQGSIESLAVLTLGALAILGLVLSITQRRLRVSHGLLFFGISYFALQTKRTLPFAAVVSLPLVVTGLRHRSFQNAKLPLISLALSLGLGAYVGFYASQHSYHTTPLFKAKPGLRRHPVFDYPGLEALPQNQPYFNNLNAGHALLFERSRQTPLQKPFICASTNLYSKEFYNRYRAAAKGLGLTQLLDDYRLNWAFVDHRTAPELFVAMTNLGGWNLHQLNHSCAIFRRSSRATTNPNLFKLMLNQAKQANWHGAFSSDSEQRGQQMLHLATALELTGRDSALQIALILIGKLKQQRPDWLAALELEARLLLAQGFKAKADQHYDRLAKAHPQHARIQLSAANSALTSNRLELARQRFLKARKLGALPQAADRGLAQTLLASQDLIGLRRHIHSSSLKPEWQAFFKGRAAAVEKSYKRAQKFYSQALKAQPDLHLARYYLAELFYHMRDYQSSAAEFAKLLARQPKDADAWEYYGAALFKLAKFDAASHAWANATKLNPRRPNLWFNLARAHLQTKTFKDAEQANQQCLKLVRVFRQQQTLTGPLKASLKKLEQSALLLKAQIDRQKPKPNFKAPKIPDSPQSQSQNQQAKPSRQS